MVQAPSKTRKPRRRRDKRPDTRRSYHQYCALARALDLLGERWTLLIVREGLSGPKRYTDLLDALPGIGTNLLAERLRQMEADGLLGRRRLPPPADCQVYELTAWGRQLEPLILGLARWGSSLLRTPARADHFHPTYALMGLRYRFRPESAKGVREDYEFHVGDHVFHARIEDGTLETALGPVEDPAFVLTIDERNFLRIVAGQRLLEEGLRDGWARVEGSLEALQRSAEIFPDGDGGDK